MWRLRIVTGALENFGLSATIAVRAGNDGFGDWDCYAG